MYIVYVQRYREEIIFDSKIVEHTTMIFMAKENPH